MKHGKYKAKLISLIYAEISQWVGMFANCKNTLYVQLNEDLSDFVLPR